MHVLPSNMQSRLKANQLIMLIFLELDLRLSIINWNKPFQGFDLFSVLYQNVYMLSCTVHLGIQATKRNLPLKTKTPDNVWSSVRKTMYYSICTTL